MSGAESPFNIAAMTRSMLGGANLLRPRTMMMAITDGWIDLPCIMNRFIPSLLPLYSDAEFHALKDESRILGYPSNPVSGFSMMEWVRLCAVWPMENRLGPSLNRVGPLSENPTLVL